MRHLDGKECAFSLKYLTPAGDVPKPDISCKERPKYRDTPTTVKGQPGSIELWDSSADSLHVLDTESISSLEPQRAQGEPVVDDSSEASPN